MQNLPTFSASFRTHIGLRRQRQEDAVFVSQELGLFAVADGMGGHAYGDEAAQLAIRVLSNSRGHDLGAVFRAADYAIKRKKWEGVGWEDRPGTTLAAIQLRADGDFAVVDWASVGDSRVYSWGQDPGGSQVLTQISTDDTFAAALPDRDLDPRIAGMIVQAIGGHYDSKDGLVVGRGTVRLEPGERRTFLLCTDGLHGYVQDEQIAAVLAKNEDLEYAVEGLQQLALDAGGRDNITVVLLSVRGTDAAPRADLVR